MKTSYIFQTKIFKHLLSINKLNCIWYSNTLNIRLCFTFGSSAGKESACNAGDPASIPGSVRSPGEGMATHYSILPWRIPWIEEPRGLQPLGSQRVGYDWVTFTFTFKQEMGFYGWADRTGFQFQLSDNK